MTYQLQGNGGVVFDVDPNRNCQVVRGERGYSAGGEYTVGGGVTAAIGAGLAANTTFASLRFSSTSTRKAYITCLQVITTCVTAGLGGGIPTLWAWQRFTAATPTGGTARTVAKKNAAHSASDMFDVRDHTAALTVTGVTFGVAEAQSYVNNGSTLVNPAEWLVAPEQEPLVLVAGDGICLRSLGAGPAGATWMYSYTVQWYEK